MGQALRLFDDEKVCFKCNKLKPLNEFYRHPSMTDGYLGKCKACTRNDVKERSDRLLEEDPSFLVTERARGRDKYQRLYKGKKVDPSYKRKVNQTYWKKYPEKEWVRRHAYGLPKLEKGLQYHHWSYNPEHSKDVIVLTISEHKKAHRYLPYDQKSKMFRTLDGTLLDSREKHEQYLEAVRKLF